MHFKKKILKIGLLVQILRASHFLTRARQKDAKDACARAFSENLKSEPVGRFSKFFFWNALEFSAGANQGNEFAVNGRFNSKNCKNVYFFSFLKNPSGGVPAPDLTEGVKTLPRAYLKSWQWPFSWRILFYLAYCSACCVDPWEYHQSITNRS